MRGCTQQVVDFPVFLMSLHPQDVRGLGGSLSNGAAGIWSARRRNDIVLHGKMKLGRQTDGEGEGGGRRGGGESRARNGKLLLLQ